MDKAELIQIFSKEQRIDITHPGCLREESGRVIRQVSFNKDMVTYSGRI